jgi:hypothetical protein
MHDGCGAQQNVACPLKDTEPDAEADAALELAVREIELE